MEDTSGNHYLAVSPTTAGVAFYGNILQGLGLGRLEIDVGYHPSGATATLTAYAEPVTDPSNQGIAALTPVARQNRKTGAM